MRMRDVKISPEALELLKAGTMTTAQFEAGVREIGRTGASLPEPLALGEEGDDGR